MSQKQVIEGSTVQDQIPVTHVCVCVPAQGACRVNYANKAEHLFFLCIMYVAHDEPEKALCS